MNDFIRNLFREFALRIFWGSKLTGPVNSKAFQLNNGETMSSYDAIMQTSLNDKCLSNKISRKDLVRSHDCPEFEFYPVDETCQSSYENESYEDKNEGEAIDEFE